MSNLTFGKKKKRVNYDLLREILVWVIQIALVCGFAFVLVWCFGKRVSVIGDSMQPELANGDVALVNKLVYNISSPKRGDVIAFQPNGNENSHYYIKRVIGLPGETVEVKDGVIFIDGEELKEKYETTELEELGLLENPIELGKNEYFVLGDDRLSSEDSRSSEIGNIQRSDIKGKVWFVVSGENFGFVR